jgi:hypothetical protein
MGCIEMSCDSTGPELKSKPRWCASPHCPSIGTVDFAAHIHRIIAVEVVGEHQLRVAFDDGVNGEIDLSA